jgi:hypothetical protein
MMVERYPNLKEEVGGLVPGCEISSTEQKTCQAVNCLLLCFDTGMSAFCLNKIYILIILFFQKKVKEEEEEVPLRWSNRLIKALQRG